MAMSVSAATLNPLMSPGPLIPSARLAVVIPTKSVAVPGESISVEDRKTRQAYLRFCLKNSFLNLQVNCSKREEKQFLKNISMILVLLQAIRQKINPNWHTFVKCCRTSFLVATNIFGQFRKLLIYQRIYTYVICLFL